MRFSITKQFPSLEGVCEWQQEVRQEFTSMGEYAEILNVIKTLGNGKFEASVEFEPTQGDLFDRSDNVVYPTFPRQEG